MDGLEAAKKMYSGPPAGDDAPAGYEDLFGPPALSAEKAKTPPADDPADDPDRVPFDSDAGFYELRGRCLDAARRYGSPYARLLRTLRGAEPLERHRAEEERGASYRRLCKAAHAAGLSKRERKNLYWIAERVGMSDRFAGHILASLKQDGGGRR